MSQDPVVVAMAIIADPRRRFTVSSADIMAICRALVEAGSDAVPTISNDLANAARTYFAARGGWKARSQEIGTIAAAAEADAAFKTFADLFEQEFPND